MKPEIVGGDILDQVRLVKYDRTIIRQDLAKLVTAHIEIGKEKMVIDDHDIGRLGPAPHSRNKTRLKIGAFLADTRFALGVNAAPERQIFR